MKDISEELYIDILKSIKLIHSAGVLHTDIRSSNYMHFQCYGCSNYQLIDFDLSSAMNFNSRGADVTLSIDSEQTRRAPLM